MVPILFVSTVCPHPSAAGEPGGRIHEVQEVTTGTETTGARVLLPSVQRTVVQ